MKRHRQVYQRYAPELLGVAFDDGGMVLGLCEEREKKVTGGMLVDWARWRVGVVLVKGNGGGEFGGGRWGGWYGG